jgi:hypothetical protein
MEVHKLRLVFGWQLPPFTCLAGLHLSELVPAGLFYGPESAGVL